jgi:hypothetical protein
MVNKARMKGKGEGKTHIAMNTFVYELMKEMGYIDVRERYPIRHKNPNSDNEWIAKGLADYHEVDVHGAQIMHLKDGNVLYFKTYVEIDGEWHDNKIQKNKDKTAEQLINEYHDANPKLGKHRIIRLKKPVVLKAMKSGNTDELKKKLALVIHAH